MLKKSDLHEYQVKSALFIEEWMKCGLFVDMGMGKTVSTLTACEKMLSDRTINRVLVIAPLRVANTVWQQEAEKWEHLCHLDIKIATGSEKKRIKAIEHDADIHVINRECVSWLVHKRCTRSLWLWDMLVIDESTSFKNHKSSRFVDLKRVLPFFKSVVILTGTPSPNSVMDLWSQVYLLDGGERLGKFITRFRDRYFTRYNRGVYNEYIAMPSSQKKIKEKIKDICLHLDKNDYMELPEKIILKESVELSNALMKQYRKLKRDLVLKLENGEIMAQMAATASMKLFQFCNGTVYGENLTKHHIHNEKVHALAEIFEDNPNENFLIAYTFKSDMEKLLQKFPDMVLLDNAKSMEIVKKWNEGKINKLLCHPASCGHGLNIQHGGSVIIWFGLTWSLELYQQFNARLHRQGQTKPVRVIHIVVKGGIDERIINVLNGKAKEQQSLLDCLKDDS